MRVTLVLALLSSLAFSVAHPGNQRRAAWPWLQKEDQTTRIQKRVYDDTSSSRCWPDVQDAFIRLLVIVQNLPDGALKSSPFIAALDNLGVEHGLDLFTPSGIKTFICRVKESEYGESDRNSEPVEEVVSKFGTLEKFSTYAYAVDLFRPPPLTRIDKEEALSQVSDLADVLFVGNKDLVLQAAEIYLDSNSLEEAIRNINAATGSDLAKMYLNEEEMSYMKLQVESMIMYANPLSRLIQAADQAGALQKLFAAGLTFFI